MRVARQIGLLLEQETIDGQANCIETWLNPLQIVPLGSNDSDLEYERDLGVLLVGHVQAENLQGRRFHVRRQRQSVCCTTDTDANLDARAKSVAASSAYNSSDIR